MIYTNNNMRTSFNESVFKMSKEEFKKVYKDKLSDSQMKEMLSKFPDEKKKGKSTIVGKELEEEGGEY